MGNNTKSLAVGVTAIGVVALAAYAAWSAVGSVFSGASDNVKAASIAAFVTVLTFLIGRYMEQRREIKQKVNQEKIRVYQKFFDLWFGLFRASAEAERTDSQQNLVDDMREFQKELILWGSDSVIHAWDTFMSIASSAPQNKSSVDHEYLGRALSASAKLIIAMRRDVGYPFTSIKEGDFARLILSRNDPEATKLLARVTQ